MELVVKVTAIFMLMTLCQPRSMKSPSMIKLSGTDLDYFQHLMAMEEKEDNIEKDPDWLPKTEDYSDEEIYPNYDAINDYDEKYDETAEDYDNLVKDPDWVPTADDYIDEEEDPDYDSIEVDDSSDSDDTDTDIDNLWSSDDDPDWIPEDNSDENNSNSTEESEESKHDPDWTPTDHDSDEDSLENNEVDQPNAELAKGKIQLKSSWFSQDFEDQNDDIIHIQKMQEKVENQAQQLNQYDTGSFYGNQADQINGGIQESHLNFVNQANPPSQHDIATGVEPLDIIGNRDPIEVGSGVEPEYEEPESNASPVYSWFEKVFSAADKVGDHVENTVGNLGEKITGVVDKVQGAVSAAADKVEDTANSVSESVVSTYHKVKGKLPELLHRIRRLFTKFGVLVQSGAEYFIHHMEKSVDQVREAEILDKLQQKLAEGNEQVTAFFQLLGEKIFKWKLSHGHESVDAGLIPRPEGEEGEVIQSGQLGQQSIPNLFQDQEVTEQLTQMVNSGVISQNDLDLLSQQQSRQHRSHHQHESLPIQIESSGSERSLRALIDALMVR